MTAQNLETSLSRSTVSDESGAYLITNLPVGDYVITAQKQGFTKYVQKGITLTVDQNALRARDIARAIEVSRDHFLHVEGRLRLEKEASASEDLAAIFGRHNDRHGGAARLHRKSPSRQSVRTSLRHPQSR